ncbi:hypothetical protein FGB62_476g01 [Gracilaria domingensis]|nr:hypothetical protein FGB62_476g01 [Gracilaria domingensis]
MALLSGSQKEGGAGIVNGGAPDQGVAHDDGRLGKQEAGRGDGAGGVVDGQEVEKQLLGKRLAAGLDGGGEEERGEKREQEQRRHDEEKKRAVG